MKSTLLLNMNPSVQAYKAGLFISRGKGIHPDRIIDTHELIFVRSGTLGLFEGQRRFTVKAGQAVLLQPGRRHGGTEPYPPDLSFYWIHFRLRATAGASKTNHALRLPAQSAVSRPDRLTELFRLFLDDQETGGLTPLTADLMIMLMLGELAAVRPSPAAGDSAAAKLASRADLFIRLHFHEPLTASSVAATLRCNADYLGHVFRRAYSHTLTEAIHRHRHQKARALLLDGALSIKEIARVSGYEDAGYFRRLFRRQEGFSPSAFRQLYAHMYVNVE